MFGRKKTTKEEQQARGRPQDGAAQQQLGDSLNSSRSGTPYAQRYAGTPSGGQDPSLQGSQRMVSFEEYQRLKELLETKCDEVDDLSNNLKLAKDSLRQVPRAYCLLCPCELLIDIMACVLLCRHLSEKLDKTNEELSKAKDENGVLVRENKDLKHSLSSMQNMADEKLEMAGKLEEGLLKFQADLEVLLSHLSSCICPAHCKLTRARGQVEVTCNTYIHAVCACVNAYHTRESCMLQSSLVCHSRRSGLFFARVCMHACV
jgi:hypothetical protein